MVTKNGAILIGGPRNGSNVSQNVVSRPWRPSTGAARGIQRRCELHKKMLKHFALWEKQQNWMWSFKQLSLADMTICFQLYLRTHSLHPGELSNLKSSAMGPDTLAEAVDLIFLFFLFKVFKEWRSGRLHGLIPSWNQDKYKVKYTISDFRQV